MSGFVAGSPGSVYTETDVVRGKCPSAGNFAEMTDSQGTKKFWMCKVAASQNLVNGHVVTISRVAGGAGSDYVATVAAASGPGSSAALVTMVGVAVCSITASASMQIWVQVYGRGNVKASVSQNPNVPLKIGTTAGVVTATAAASASGLVDGIVLLNTSSVQGAIAACFLNYPKFGPSGIGA